MRLAPDGVFSFGLKIGRRSAELVLIDFNGEPRQERQLTYATPKPDEIFDFLDDGVHSISQDMKSSDVARICGLGIAAPFEMWNWPESGAAPSTVFPHTWQTKMGVSALFPRLSM